MMDSTELIETDITNLQAPVFTTLSRGPPEPITKLKWDHKVNLIGQKVLNPMIHICEKCNKPILIYGRLIPCRHVFCLNCAKEEDKVCMRCKEGINRVEQAMVGHVFMCTHGGTKYGQDGCRRTYLSSRDLTAHMNHRHLKQQQVAAPSTPQVPQTVVMPNAPKDIQTMKELYLQQQRLVNAQDIQNRHEGRAHEGRMPNEARGGHHEGRPAHEGRQHLDPRAQHDARRLLPPQVSPQPPPQGVPPINQIPVLTTRNPNLVTVPIQESPAPPLATPSLRFPPGYQPGQPIGGFNYPPGQAPPPGQQHFRQPPPNPFYQPQQPRYPPNFQGQPPVNYDQNPQFRPPAAQPWPGQPQYYR